MKYCLHNVQCCVIRILHTFICEHKTNSKELKFFSDFFQKNVTQTFVVELQIHENWEIENVFLEENVRARKSFLGYVTYSQIAKKLVQFSIEEKRISSQHFVLKKLIF